jgi:hypothetical protein
MNSALIGCPNQVGAASANLDKRAPKFVDSAVEGGLAGKRRRTGEAMAGI